MSAGGGGGLMSVAVHPRFAETGWVYLTYTKAAERGRRGLGLARGRLRGMALEDVRELFTVDEAGGGPPPGLPLVFAPDGHLYFFIGGANDEIAQRGDSYYGKVLRFNDDGSVPPNPFAGREGFGAEIFTIGHRNGIGLTIHPTTGAVWQNENGPYGGDEVNILKPGANYGWPLVSYGRDYSGAPVSDKRTLEGVEDPVLFWVPSIAISGMTFYTGDRFPAWRNNLFVGGLQYGRIPRTGQMQRVVFNEEWQEIRRESFFEDLRQRIRDVAQGPGRTAVRADGRARRRAAQARAGRVARRRTYGCGRCVAPFGSSMSSSTLPSGSTNVAIFTGMPPIGTEATSPCIEAPAAFAAATVAARSDTWKIACAMACLPSPGSRTWIRNSGDVPALAAAAVAP